MIENPILGCRDIMQKPSLILLGHPVENRGKKECGRDGRNGKKKGEKI